MMRDLIDKLKLLTESVGLANRKPGDVFKNADGNILTFSGLDFYPEQGGKLEEPELNQLVSDLNSTNVKWQNKQPKSGGVAIARFDSEAGPIQYGFFLRQINPVRTANKVPNSFDGYNYSSKTAVKEKSGLAPKDLLAQRDNLSASDIINQLDSNESLSPELKKLARAVAAGGPYPIKIKKPEGVSFEAIRDYYCEILHPIALQTGKFKGNAGDAAERFMGGSFADTLISFSEAKNSGLSDSILSKSDGKYIKISSKGGSGGASASVKNLYNAFNELASSPQGQKLAEKYKDTIELIHQINKHGQNLSPLYLGEKYGIIDHKDYMTILNFKQMPPVNLADIDSYNVSDNIKKLAKSRKPKDPSNVNLYYHMIAIVAKLAAEKVNETDFGHAASDILNNGALIQVYSDKSLKQQGDELVLSEFETKFPGESVRDVEFDAEKTYYSTGINGNFTFYIDRGQGKVKKTAPSDLEGDKETKLKPVQNIAKSLTEPRLKRDTTPTSEPKSDVGPAGRALR